MRIVYVGVLLLFLTGCSLENSNTNYAAAKELPAPHFPADSLAVSHRYDIPEVPGDTGKLLTSIMPPDYY